ncbi:anti-sigma factor family protein [Mucilaginibacter sp.]|uniref:anti-sigma factor family protein n=1 Tax=Mucilaginibacter sp. TaxID=1882438 RepID=UPI0035BBC1F2
MNSIEEKLWNYIDGACTEQERQAIAMLIETDEACRVKYEELLKLNQHFSSLEIDEPSMAFTYSVMENIRAEQAMQPLKSAINKRIILAIGAFFIITIAALMVMTLSNVNWNTPDDGITMPEVNVKQVNNLFTAPVLKGFLFFDLVMGLFLLDTYLRRKSVIKQP